MAKSFEELDFRITEKGELSLRRRHVLLLGGKEVYEVKLGEEYLMSSLFHDVEVALAKLGLAQLKEPEIDVVVGGLGLGYTAVAALEDERVRSLLVVEALDAVIEWHQDGKVPLGPQLTGDTRCRMIHRDFFALANEPAIGFDPAQPARRFHAILLDIDHTPRLLLDSKHASFYSPQGLKSLSEHLHPNGIFAMWSDGGPDGDFLQLLEDRFQEVRAEVVTFHNPLLRIDSSSTVYLARKRA